jgi:Holliday junction resolvase RusA-like endonuclease
MRVLGTPSPASRPRVSRFGTYYVKPYQVWMASCQQQMAEQAKSIPAGNLVCAVEVLVEKPKTSKLTIPRGDVDNLAKGLLDGATKAGVWGDDGQITTLIVRKRFTLPGEAPGAIIHVGAET